MPVPFVGLYAQIPVIQGIKRRLIENWRTVMVLLDCIQFLFGALMIGYTITG